MKLKIEKQEWQLWSQLVVEIANGEFPEGFALESLMMWEYWYNNTQLFAVPTTRKKKLSQSMIYALCRFLMAQAERNDPLWDCHLRNFRDKMYRCVKSFPVSETLELHITQNVGY